MEMICCVHRNQKRAGATVLMSGQTDKNCDWRPRGTYYTEKESVHHEDTTVIDRHASANRAPRYRKLKLPETERDIENVDSNCWRPRYVNRWRKDRECGRRERHDKSTGRGRHTRNSPHSNRRATRPFQGGSYSTGQMLPRKTRLNKYKRAGDIQSMFFDHSGIKLKTINSRKFGKLINVRKLKTHT